MPVANKKPTLRAVTPPRTPSRIRLAEKLDELRDAQADVRECEEAIAKARAMQAELDKEFAELIAEKAPTPDSRLADFVSGRIDVRGEGEQAKAYNERLADLEAQHKNLQAIRKEAEEAINTRKRTLEYAERAVDAAAREVLAHDVIDMPALSKRFDTAKKNYEAVLNELNQVYSVSPSTSEVGKQAHLLGLRPVDIGNLDTVNHPLRQLLARLKSNPDAV